MTSNRIVLDYTSRDYKAIRSMLVGLAKGLVPEWTTVGETGDFGTLLLELYAYAGDVNNYYVDRLASEAFLGTAVRRQSIMYIADMFGYTPLGQRAATVPVSFTWAWDTNVVDPPESLAYTVTSATYDNGVATLELTSSTYAVTIVPGQTITVSGVGDPFDGIFVVKNITAAGTSTPFSLTYDIYTTGTGTGTTTATSEVSTGSVVLIPVGTVLTTDGDDPTLFELNFDILLDSAAAQPIATGSTVYSISKLASASEGRTVAPIQVGVSKGIPNAEFIIPDPGVIDRTIQVYTIEGGQVITWTEVDKLSLSTPTQSVFTTYVDDENYTHVLFGDNASGRIPPTNVEIYVGYRYGVGAAANTIGANSVVIMKSDYANSLGVTVTNTSPPVGGADVESTDSIRYSVPRSNALKQRAVTLSDYVNLALQVPGVTKAVAYGQNYTTVYVRVASSAASSGYTTAAITHRYVNSNVATMVLDTDLTVNVGQQIYVSGSGVTALDGAFGITKIYYNNGSSASISNKELTSNVATLTTSTSHGFTVGQPVTVSGVGAPFDGTHILTAVTATTFSFAKTNADVASAAATGTVTPEFGLSYAATTSNILEAAAVSAGTLTTTNPDMQSLINSVESYLSDKKLIGSVVYAEPVEWADTTIDIDVVVRPLYNREAVRAAVQAAVEDVFSYETVDFGKRISIGDVYRAALSVEGVDYITLNTLLPSGSGASITNTALTSNVVTITTAADHGFTAGQLVTITNATDPTYNGTYVIASTPLSTTFTYSLTHADISSASSSGKAISPSPVVDIDENSVGSGYPYMLPRIDPYISGNWVSATGGLVNT